jgi:mRNA-degrading endonuclease toxin of MazEF toxin-antitoxin module
VSLCALITDYKPERDKPRFWRVVIGAAPESGLTKVSCADVSQTRALDIARFVRQAGRAHVAEVEATAAALAQTVGYQPPQPKPQDDEANG